MHAIIILKFNTISKPNTRGGAPIAKIQIGMRIHLHCVSTLLHCIDYTFLRATIMLSCAAIIHWINHTFLQAISLPSHAALMHCIDNIASITRPSAPLGAATSFTSVSHVVLWGGLVLHRRLPSKAASVMQCVHCMYRLNKIKNTKDWYLTDACLKRVLGKELHVCRILCFQMVCVSENSDLSSCACMCMTCACLPHDLHMRVHDVLVTTTLLKSLTNLH